MADTSKSAGTVHARLTQGPQSVTQHLTVPEMVVLDQEIQALRNEPDRNPQNNRRWSKIHDLRHSERIDALLELRKTLIRTVEPEQVDWRAGTPEVDALVDYVRSVAETNPRSEAAKLLERLGISFDRANAGNRLVGSDGVRYADLDQLHLSAANELEKTYGVRVGEHLIYTVLPRIVAFWNEHHAEKEPAP